MREALIEVHGRDDLINADMEGTEWNHVRQVIGDEHWNWIFSAEGVNHVLNRPNLMYRGATQVLNELSEIADLVFITHRSPICAAATAQWIASHGAPFSALHVVGSDDGNHLPKSAVQPQCDIYVEDSPTNVRDLLGETEAFVLCPRRSYNESLEGQHDRLFMFNDLSFVSRFARTLRAEMSLDV